MADAQQPEEDLRAQDIIIGDIRKTEEGGDNNIVRVTVKNFYGKWYIDLRQCFLGDDNIVKYTKKGVSLGVEKIDVLLQHILQAAKEIKNRSFVITAKGEGTITPPENQ